jgi:glycosyltransferase involved in cell wall biosynthesis
LLSRGHEVVCFTVTEESEGVVRASHEELHRHAHQGQLVCKSYSPVYAGSTLIRRAKSLAKPFSEITRAPGLLDDLSRELSRGYDVLHLEQLWTGWLGAGVHRTLLNVHHFELIDLEDRPVQGLRDWKARLQMARATKRILRAHSHVRVFTSRLLAKARQFNPDAEYHVVPFALDLGLYELQQQRPEPVLGLIGSMHWIPSRSAAERLITRIWPQVKRRVPKARLFIAGWNAKKYLSRFVSLPDVTIEDSVPHPTDFFSQASVMVYAPSRGSGMKIKVMEAMAYGVPVVTTWEGVEGLEYENGTHCWVEEEDDVIAQRAASLLEDRAARDAMRMAARQLLETRYSPDPVVDQVVRVYEGIKAR